MKADLREELDLLNRNVDEMIRLFQRTADAGIWTKKEAAHHEARLEVLSTKLNADFNELVALRDCAAGRRLSERNQRPQPASDSTFSGE